VDGFSVRFGIDIETLIHTEHASPQSVDDGYGCEPALPELGSNDKLIAFVGIYQSLLEGIQF
jgi:hypothetical protein